VNEKGKELTTTALSTYLPYAFFLFGGSMPTEAFSLMTVAAQYASKKETKTLFCFPPEAACIEVSK